MLLMRCGRKDQSMMLEIKGILLTPLILIQVVTEEFSTFYYDVA